MEDKDIANPTGEVKASIQEVMDRWCVTPSRPDDRIFSQLIRVLLFDLA